MSIELPFGGTSQTHRCPLCGAACRVHPITDRHAPGGFSRQISCDRYGYGCEYSEDAEQAARATRLMVSADNLAVLAEWQGEALPGPIFSHMMRRRWALA